MRQILLFLLWFLFAESAVACRCAPEILNEKFACADVVVHARVRKTFPNASRENPYYKIEIEPIRTFKGSTVSELFEYGSMDGISRTSCDLYVREGSEWIIYASMRDGILQFDMCSGSQEIHKHGAFSGNKTYEKSVRRKLEALDFLGRKAGTLTYRDPVPFIFCIGSDFFDFLKSYGGTNFRKPFGQYRIDFNADLEVSSVSVLRSLNRKFDRKLIAKLEGKKFCRSRSSSEKPVTHPVLLGIYCLDDPRGGVVLTPFGP